MTTKKQRFELVAVNGNGQADIYDWVESKEKNAICIYNDLGVLPFSSANHLCDLLNELHWENTVLKEEIKKLEDPHGMFICTDIGEVKRRPHLVKYSMCYSKTDEDTILEDHHFIDGIHPWNSLETKKHIVELLNDKEKQIYNLTKENDFLKWYCEELETHLPKELLKQVKEFYKNNVRKIGE